MESTTQGQPQQPEDHKTSDDHMDAVQAGHEEVDREELLHVRRTVRFRGAVRRRGLIKNMLGKLEFGLLIFKIAQHERRRNLGELGLFLQIELVGRQSRRPVPS